jgi:hypothetical protein
VVARIHARRHRRLARGVARNHPARCGARRRDARLVRVLVPRRAGKAGYCEAGTAKLRQAGVKRIVYYDLGEVGDYAAFFTADGKMKHNGWSLPWWDGKEPLTARWLGLEAFLRDVPWAPFPSAKTYGLPPFTTPDGKPADDLYAVLARRGLDGQWSYDYSSNPGITDDFAQRSGLAKLSGKQSGPADTQGKSGWQMVRLVDVDYANPQMRDYVCREIEHIIPKLRPDGIHADNLSDTNLGHANTCAFGLWSLHTFRDYLRRHFTPAELERMGIADVATFDIAAYIRDKPFETRGKRWHILNPKWTEDPVWLCYVIHKVETAQAYHRAFYAAAKKSAQREKLDCAVFGNTIPFPLGGALMKGACDIAHFEWSTVHGHWGLRPMGLPPKGRVGYVTRLGAAISDAPFCWPSIYVSQDKSGAGHENLHKVLAFDCLANRGLLDFGHWYLDGYSPGTPQSAGFVNRFIRAHAPRLSHRRYLADVAVVHSAWSEIASMNVFNPIMDKFVDEYCGWCDFLGDTHRQWDVVLQSELTAKNLARYPVVVLPSVMTLTDADISELRRYVEGGGRLVATGYFRSISFFMSSVMGMTSKSLKNIRSRPRRAFAVRACPSSRTLRRRYRRAESVQDLDQPVAVGGGAGRVPLVVLVADLLDELVVRDDPAATGNRLAVDDPGGVPEGGVLAAVGDFVLESAQHPRGLRFFGAEVQRAVAAVHAIRDAGDEVVVILGGNDQPVPASALGWTPCRTPSSVKDHSSGRTNLASTSWYLPSSPWTKNGSHRLSPRSLTRMFLQATDPALPA